MSKGDGPKQNSLGSLRGGVIKNTGLPAARRENSAIGVARQVLETVPRVATGLLRCNKWMMKVVCDLHMGKLVKVPLLQSPGQRKKGLDCSEVQRDLDPMSFILFHS